MFMKYRYDGMMTQTLVFSFNQFYGQECGASVDFCDFVRTRRPDLFSLLYQEKAGDSASACSTHLYHFEE